MLINVCRQRRVSDNVDKWLETGENCRTRSEFEHRDMLVNILNSYAAKGEPADKGAGEDGDRVWLKHI